MDAQPRHAVQLLAAALALGISADTLLRASPPGINAALWLLFLFAALVILARRLDHRLVGGWKLVAVPGILCAMSLTWRDSPVLTFLNVTGALAACALVGMRTSSRRLRESSVFEIVHGMFVHLVHAIAGAGFLIARELTPDRSPVVRRKSPLPSLLRGVALAVPFLLLFGSLFAAADASFEHLVGSLFDFDLSSLFIHILVTGFFGWTAAGFLRGSLAAEEVPAPATLRESYLSLGITEVGILLGFLDALFFLFVAMQIPYLFGGATTVAATASLTYAAYARRGFFELTAVACFTIVTLLWADWILRKDSRRNVLLFRSMAGLNLLLLGGIMASAWQRLLLYQEAYGLTEARLYAAAALTGMGLVAAWFALSVLSGRRSRFVFGSIIAAYAVILSLDILNPDALIARIDIARASEGKHADPRYLATLSSDATPDLIAGLPLIPAGDRDVISRELVRRSGVNDPQDWRTWNLARTRAAAEVRSHIDSLVSSINQVSRTQEKEERTCTHNSGSR